ncbi:MAG: HEAT repeat domain-containing protein [Nitrospira sp.]|nr:HEAT repeat domain-containing protein [Nitrospira sp.]MDH4250718.1 HEAT repeat domain-containing protein [Nitrospira sp.]MDH4343532.1 HEAT repeat domain-containing protein [Nitrospira sp.]MDH5336151.1 HEAT repeat domain-containing protein [Nitrospira sp.]
MTTDLKTAQEMMAAAVATRTAEDPEILSAKRVLKLLDKTAKSNRTYGSANPVALKFTQQLFEELTTHLTTYARLAFLVQRSELLCKDAVVYQAEQDGGSENFAFKLYADGIRELVLHEGLTQEDLSLFLASLWNNVDSNEDDDDIVTRLWARNLSTITLTTAEELSKSSVGNDSLASSMSSSDSTLRELLDRERERKKRAKEETNAEGGGSGNAKNRFQSGLAGYEVTEEELAVLVQEIEAERKQDSLMYILDMLTAILASEKSPALLTKLFNLWGTVVESLLRGGKWTVLENVLSLLHETDTVRPDLGDEHKQQLASLLNGLGRTERVKMIEDYLNQNPDADVKGLSTVLLLMQADAVPSLCSLLANVTSPVHQAIVSEALVVLAKDHPDPLVRGLSDRRPGYVRNLLVILIKWNNPKFADSIERLTRYPDAQVRREVTRALGLFRPTGNGTKLVALSTDEDDGVRFAALKLLISGQYTVPFSQWSPLLSAEEFMDRPISERRAIFQAIRATCGDEAIPYWQGLMTEWTWTNRKKKEELAVLGAEALGKLATPAAIAAISLGANKGNAAVRQACATALAHAQRLQRSLPSTGSTP